jgi:hypothetical protein
MRDVQLWSVKQQMMEAEEETHLWIRTKSVKVDERTLVVQERMERVLDIHRL